MRISLKRAGTALAVPLIATGALLLASGSASAAAAIAVTPSTNLTSGATVTVSGSGFAKNSTGALLQCSNDPGQPTIVVLGNAVPVSCTNPLLALHSTTANGVLQSATFVVHEGTVGPPGTGTDSAGHSAAADAALYPCPPTAAQIAAGDTCVMAFGDLSGDKAIAPISFQGQATTTTQPGQTTTTTAAPQTTTTAAPQTTTTVHTTTTAGPSVLGNQTTGGGTLPLTGAGRRLFGLVVLGAGFLILGFALTATGRRARRVYRS